MLTETSLSASKIKNIIFSTIDELLHEKDSAHAFDEDTKLNAHLGFTSLEFARLVAILEAKTGSDPFAEKVAISSIRTIGDLVRAYVEM